MSPICLVRSVGGLILFMGGGGGVKEKVLLHSFVQKSDSLHCRLLRDCWMRVKNNPLQNKTSAGAGFVSYPVMNAALH